MAVTLLLLVDPGEQLLFADVAQVDKDLTEAPHSHNVLASRNLALMSSFRFLRGREPLVSVA